MSIFAVRWGDYGGSECAMVALRVDEPLLGTTPAMRRMSARPATFPERHDEGNANETPASSLLHWDGNKTERLPCRQANSALLRLEPPPRVSTQISMVSTRLRASDVDGMVASKNLLRVFDRRILDGLLNRVAPLRPADHRIRQDDLHRWT